MKLENVFILGWQFGLFNGYLTCVKYADKCINELYLSNQLEEIKNELNKLSIQEDTINEIIKFSNQIMDLYRKNEEHSIENTEYENELKKLNNLISSRSIVWHDRIRYVLRNINIIKLYDNLIINPKKLIEGAKSFLKGDIWNNMTPIEKEDFEDGCLCISIQAWTPGAMIIIRAIESSLRSYYQKITNEDPNEKNWGVLINELKQTSSADKKLIDYFDYLKDTRNKLQHPDARFSQDEAEDVFTHAVHIFKQIHS